MARQGSDWPKRAQAIPCLGKDQTVTGPTEPKILWKDWDSWPLCSQCSSELISIADRRATGATLANAKRVFEALRKI